MSTQRNDRVGFFLAGASFLVVILLVWAQLWWNTANVYLTAYPVAEQQTEIRTNLTNPGLAKQRSMLLTTVGWGLLGSFIGVLYALMAMGLAVQSYFQTSAPSAPQIPKPALRFLFAALYTAIADVLASVGGIIAKSIRSKSVADPHFFAEPWLQLTGTAIVVISCAIFLVRPLNPVGFHILIVSPMIGAVFGEFKAAAKVVGNMTRQLSTRSKRSTR